MGADTAPLLEQLRRDAAAAASERRAQAQREASTRLEEAKARAGARRATKLAERARSDERALEAAKAEAAQRMAKELLAARAAALEKVFARAHAHLEAQAAHPRLGDELSAALAEALTYLPDGAVAVRCPAAAMEIARAALRSAGRRDALVREDASVPLGAIAETADGAIAVDATFARRLVRRRPQLSISLVARLEGGAR